MDNASQIGVSNLPKVRLAKLKARGININVMVAGSHGLGKTTLLRHLFGISCLKSVPFAPRGNDKHWQCGNICNVQISTVAIDQCDFSIQARLTEIDCIGDSVSNSECWSSATELLEEYFRDYEHSFGGTVRALIDDKRVHVCLYMLEPLAQIRVADIEAMRAISHYCCVVPVVAKADLVEEQCMENTRTRIQQQLVSSGVNVFDDRLGGYSAPFFVMFGNDENDALSMERSYPWGVGDLRGAGGNEFDRLREFILEKSIVTLMHETEFLYDNYRTSRLASYLTQVKHVDDSKRNISDAGSREETSHYSS